MQYRFSGEKRTSTSPPPGTPTGDLLQRSEDAPRDHHATDKFVIRSRQGSARSGHIARSSRQPVRRNPSRTLPCGCAESAAHRLSGCWQGRFFPQQRQRDRPSAGPADAEYLLAAHQPLYRCSGPLLDSTHLNFVISTGGGAFAAAVERPASRSW